MPSDAPADSGSSADTDADTEANADADVEAEAEADKQASAPRSEIPITETVDKFDGYQGFFYGASAESIGESYASVTVNRGGDPAVVMHYDRVRLVLDGGLGDWVFGMRAKRAKNPTVAVFEPVDIYHIDSVHSITVTDSGADHVSDLPSGELL